MLKLLYKTLETIKVDGKPVDLPERFVILHHVKKIAIILVFWCSPITLYQFVLSLNSIPQQCENTHFGLRQSTLLCKRMNYLITNSENNKIGTSNAIFIELSHDWLTLYSNGDNQGLCKMFGLLQKFIFLHNQKLIYK